LQNLRDTEGAEPYLKTAAETIRRPSSIYAVTNGMSSRRRVVWHLPPSDKNLWTWHWSVRHELVW